MSNTTPKGVPVHVYKSRLACASLSTVGKPPVAAVTPTKFDRPKNISGFKPDVVDFLNKKAKL